MRGSTAFERRTPRVMATEDISDEVRSALELAVGAPVTLREARRLAGGASMETWSLALEVSSKAYDLVLRRDMAASMNPSALTRAQEFALLSTVHARGVKAPRPRWLYEGPGRAFFLMDKLPGEGLGRRVVKLPELAKARETLAFELGAELAKIHSVDPVDLGALSSVPRITPGRTPAQEALSACRAMMDTLGRDNPVWEFGLRWLAQNAPLPSGEVTLVHGDYRVGNVLVTPEGLSGVLDWEFSHLGDPLEDLGWIMVRDWRFERDALRVGGVGTQKDLLAGYLSAGGRATESSAIRWWEILGNLRWAVVCHAQSERHLSGQDRSVELASLGRKAAEMEWELLSLIEAQETRR